MSYFGLNPVNQNQQLDTAASNPVSAASTDVGFFDNALSAGADGLYSGLVAKPDQLLWAGLDKVVSPVAEFVSQATGITDSSPAFIAEQRKLAQQQVKRLTPDAATTGTAGQVLHGLFDMGGQAIAGTLIAGPLGGAAAVTALQGFSEFEQLQAKGVDFGTAQEAGLIQGITAGAGTLIPMSLGLRAGGAIAESVGAQLAGSGGSAARNVIATAARAAPDIAYAAGTNVAFGMAQRGLTAQTLRKGGYNEMANQYDVFDRQSIAIDAVLGVAFGGVGRFINSRGESVKAPELTPADVDAALAANSAHHAEIDTAPGVPVNALSRNAHAQAIQKAMRDISEGNPVDVASIVESSSFHAIPSRRSSITQALDDVLDVTDKGSAQQRMSALSLEQQPGTTIDTQALAYYRTADVAPEPSPVIDTPISAKETTARPTQEQAVDTDTRAAEESLTSTPDMMITLLDEEGNTQQRSAREVLDAANREHEQAVKDSSLFDVAVACFLRG